MSLFQAGNDSWLILVAVISYLLGTFPTAYLVCWKIGGRDIRQVGSGNIGAMNTYRLIRDEKSRQQAILGFSLVSLGDIVKGALAIMVVRWLDYLGYDPTVGLIVASIFVILGHNYSVLFRFRQGGRGIASLLGILLALEPRLLGVWALTIFLSIFLTELIMSKTLIRDKTRWFSIIGTQLLGRVIGIGIAPLPIYFVNPDLFLPVLAATILVLIKHIDRLQAYLKGLDTTSE
jgi:acyl-phosphate glycerol 3-phosphate acyltransferase